MSEECFICHCLITIGSHPAHLAYQWPYNSNIYLYLTDEYMTNEQPEDQYEILKDNPFQHKD